MIFKTLPEHDLKDDPKLYPRPVSNSDQKSENLVPKFIPESDPEDDIG